jgi:hypothetical protein
MWTKVIIFSLSKYHISHKPDFNEINPLFKVILCYLMRFLQLNSVVLYFYLTCNFWKIESIFTKFFGL